MSVQSPPSSNRSSYLNPRDLATIGSLNLRARLIVEGLMTGRHRSPFQGVSVEFAQHRQYAPGDDLRFLDWKVFGRTDKLYLKQFQRETNLDLVVLVDVSASMGYDSGWLLERGVKRSGGRDWRGRAGEPPLRWRKFDHAASIASALTYLAIEQQDRVGLMCFADRVGQWIRPSNARGHWRNLVAALEAVQIDPADGPDGADAGPTRKRRFFRRGERPRRTGRHASKIAQDAERSGASADARSGTDLARVFEQAAASVHQRSLIVLISDLFDDPASLESGLARLSHRRHDVMVMQVLDPAERKFPFRDPAQFVGLEAEGRLPVDPASLREAYLNALENHEREAKAICRKFRFDFERLDSGESIGPPLTRLLALRDSAIRRKG